MGQTPAAQVQRTFAAEMLRGGRRPLRLKLGCSNLAGEHLLAQRIDVQEALNGGLSARVVCLSARADLPLKSFIGQPAEIQIVTDRGDIRSLCAIVTNARAGQSDGSLTVYELQAHDALAVMQRRTNSRIYRGLSDLQIVEALLDEWRQRSPALAVAFSFSCQGIDHARYPRREFTHQFCESDASFIRRLLKRSGISWYFRPDPAAGDAPAHEMVLFDDPRRLADYAGGPIRYHRDDATEKRDAITGIVFARHLVAGAASRFSWDYKGVQMAQARERNGVDQGDAGSTLAGFLEDAQIEAPHAADSWADHERRTRLRIEHHEMRAKGLSGDSGVRDLAVGQVIRITGHPRIDAHPEEERRYIVLEIRHTARNNLPKELDVGHHLLGRGDEDADALDEDRRYRNRFHAVRADTPIRPAWNPHEDLPPTWPLTARVVGPQDEEIHTDALGRIKVQFLGYRPEDHRHGGGAGASGTGGDSAWVRCAFPLAGAGFGANFLPRVGMEVQVVFEGNDPDKPAVVGVFHNGRNVPACWSDVGELPGNRYVSGIKTREVHGHGYSQTRYDDTPGQVSLQAASSHAASQLNLGWLTHPRRDGRGQPRGQGLEARTDAQAAIRGGKGVYITAQGQPQAGAEMMERQALLGLAEQLQGIVHTLSQLSSAHHAEDTDTARIARMLEQLRAWDHGSNVKPESGQGGAPMVAIDAPAGIAAISQDALVLGAQSHIDAVSAGNTQLSAGRRLLLRAAELFSAFARKGIRIVSAEDKVQVEAHKEDIELTAAKRVVISAGEEIVIQAPRIRLVAQGTQVDHGEGRIVQQSQALHHIVSPDFCIGGAGGGSPQADVPGSSLKTDERFVLRLRTTGALAANRAYRITLDDGQMISGRTDERGRTDLPQHDAMRVADIEFPEE